MSRSRRYLLTSHAHSTPKARRTDSTRNGFLPLSRSKERGALQAMMTVMARSSQHAISMTQVSSARASLRTARSIACDPLTKKNTKADTYVPDLSLSRRETNRTFTRPPIQQRAPLQLQPLREPISDSKEDFAAFIHDISTGAGSTRIEIYPGKFQVANWRVNVDGKVIPVGATALGYIFENKPQDFSLGQLTGCTAVLAVVSCLCSHGVGFC
jgi:hypothetical protein